MWTPAYPDRHRRFPSTWVGSPAFSRKLLKWGKKSWRNFPPARKHAQAHASLPTQQLHLCLEYGPGKSIPAHTCCNSGRGRPCGCRDTARQGPIVKRLPALARAGGCRTWPDSVVAARVRAWAVPAYGLALCPWLCAVCGCRMRSLPGRRSGWWALATGPGGALLARRLPPGAST